MIFDEFLFCNIIWIFLFKADVIEPNPFLFAYTMIIFNLAITIVIVDKMYIKQFMLWLVLMTIQVVLLIGYVPIEVQYKDIFYSCTVLALWIFIRTFFQNFIIKLFIQS